MRQIKRIIVHHSAGPTTETIGQVRRYHTDPPPHGRGWSDIAYHWFIRCDTNGVWSVWAGRPEERTGAHDEGQNADSIGICIAGDYSRGPVHPDGWALLVKICVEVCHRYGLSAEGVEGHRENEPASTPTKCPGFDPGLLRSAIRHALSGESGIGVSTGLRATS